MADGFAYVATTTGFLILDVSDPTEPRQVGGYATDGPALRIAVKDGFVYLLTSSNQVGGATLSRFDVHNPALPQKVSQYVGSSAGDFALAGDLCCVVDGPSLLILNTNLDKIGTLTTTNGTAQGIAASISSAFVAWPAAI